MTIADLLAQKGIRYVSSIPRTVPEGYVLVHNHVRPRQRLGASGFRAWIEPEDPSRLVRCDCAWAGADLHGLPHFRVDRGD